jgi:hypothetical protein
VIPTGSPSVEEQQHTQLGPELLWVKGFGQDLPNKGFLKYLRPFAFQGDVGYTPALGGRTWHELFADNVIEYSLPYLSNNVRDIGLPWPVRNMYPYVEFNYDQLIDGPAGQTLPQWQVTPGIAFLNYYIELSVATQLAINKAAVPDPRGSSTRIFSLTTSSPTSGTFGEMSMHATMLPATGGCCQGSANTLAGVGFGGIRGRRPSGVDSFDAPMGAVPSSTCWIAMDKTK